LRAYKFLFVENLGAPRLLPLFLYSYVTEKRIKTCLKYAKFLKTYWCSSDRIMWLQIRPVWKWNETADRHQ